MLAKRELSPLRRTPFFGGLFDTPLDDLVWRPEKHSPVYNRGEWTVENDELVFTLNIPGQTKEDVEIEVIPEENMISIKTKDYLSKRTLSSKYKLEDAKAKVEHGILTLRLPIKESYSIKIDID